MPSTSRLLIARPRPVPPYLRVVDASACLREIVKEGFQFLGRNSDAGVGDGKSDLAGLAGFRVLDCQHDLLNR